MTDNDRFFLFAIVVLALTWFFAISELQVEKVEVVRFLKIARGSMAIKAVFFLSASVH
jgi:hypothetical protein